MENNKEVPGPLEEPSEEPSEDSSEAYEESKDVARGMLLEGIPFKEVAEETGLGIKSVYGIKGGLVKAGHIPTTAERKRMERKKPGSEEQAFLEEEEEGGKIPFRRPVPHHVLVERTLRKFGVKDRTKDIIVDRCKTAGSMHPSEFEGALLKLDTGLKRSETNFMVEDYYLALQAEHEKEREFSDGRSWPMQRGESRRGEGFSTGYGGRGSQPSDGRDYDLGGRPWDRQRRGYGEEPLTTRHLTDILERERRSWEEQARKEREQETLGQLREDIGVMATELRNIKENPPVQPTPQGPSDYERTLEHTIDRQDKRQDELMTLVKEERSEAKEDMKELRDTYGGRVDKLQEDLKASERRASSRSTTEGYRSDEIRLVADMGNKFTDVLRERGSPIRIVFENLPNLLGEAERLPQRERGQPASVADLVGSEYVER